MSTHFTARVDIFKVTKTTINSRDPQGQRDKEEIMNITLRDETLRGLVNKVTAILEVNVPTPAMVAEREGE
ncbi:hypothetical protein SEA_RIVERDALE_39 [Arthrobacter phage Riverdale]|uniref:Uncharacterized protein n=7 Tax=Korravirus glenn TaxID=1982079 RepID=A0A3S9U9T7_9CAUD|nr:hypothetical protein FDH57_gp39 [Arthrobacter phage Glenn]ALY09248.1 hypothetical protein IMMACULATA_38 [Arthrobacter phage Immaculata]AOT24129.1 hypothetical protein SEA_VALLEJO_39 [Arthrobacter phage Vallejo]AZF97415.1 hypothetical protein SEA_CARPAL_38 [Arthrobacter phage Carpal]AZS07082.1 hypothetical protein SEA_CHOLULA_38 [Arthrobacter phage Cholula]AZS09731.1 hypothetical protein SEA_RIVERDALE_39 [Arthrobacter phage Riverdale]AZS11861.1 hypothetical protein SEA_POTATOES_38 [Arthroba